MDRAESVEPGRERSNQPVTLAQRTLVVLCGPAGSGKSTFARRLVKRNQGLKTTMIVSSDQCRALVCDDEANQQVNRDTFDLFHYIIHKRMFQHRFTIADSTALHAEARRKLLEVAERHAYQTCLLIFHVSHQTCLQRDRGRQRSVGEQVIAYHAQLLEQTLLDAPNEHWGSILVLDEQEMNKSFQILLK